MGSSARFEAEKEDEDGSFPDAHGAFFDTSPVQYASSGALVPPHTKKEAHQYASI